MRVYFCLFYLKFLVVIKDGNKRTYVPSSGGQDTSAYQLSVFSYCPKITVGSDAYCSSGTGVPSSTLPIQSKVQS